jgi:hypothetical protein
VMHGVAKGLQEGEMKAVATYLQSLWLRLRRWNLGFPSVENLRDLESAATLFLNIPEKSLESQPWCRAVVSLASLVRLDFEIGSSSIALKYFQSLLLTSAR